MIARFRSWWQKTSKTLDAIVILMLVVLLALTLVSILGYTYNWNWAGLHGKTFWDWLQLLIIPAVLAVGGYLFNYTTTRNERIATEQHAQTEREIAQDNQQEVTLQEYINKMSELLLNEELCKPSAKEEVRKIARVRTSTVLPRLNGRRKGIVLQFLYEAQLINKGEKVIDLHGAILTGAILTGAFLVGADLRYANLSGADLYEADLRGADLRETILEEANLYKADLSEANLRGANLDVANLRKTILEEANLDVANLSGADLSGADLDEADLVGADLSGADLSGAYLGRAKVTDEELAKAKSLKGATMPDGSIHD